MSAASFLAGWLSPSPGDGPTLASATLHWEGPRITGLDLEDVGSILRGNSRGLPHVLAVASDLPVHRRLLVPSLANAHDHARTYRSSTLGGSGQPLESWLPLLTLLPGVDPYLVAASSFARSLRQGVTSLMVHYTRMQGTMSPLEEALSVARAARDVGLKIGFAVAFKDSHPLAYCDDAKVLQALRPSIRDRIASRLATAPFSLDEQMDRFKQIAAAIEADDSLSDSVTVQLGPLAVQWCSQPLLEAIAKESAESQRPVHMHLLETRYQREWADEAFPGGIVRYLDELGLLSPRLTLAHCAWARPQELELLSDRGVTIAVNTSSNLHLRSGIAPVQAMREAGCRIAMGLDGLAFDEDDDGFREMRLAGALHRGWGFETNWSDADLWRFASVHGRRSVLGALRDDALPGGRLQQDHAADFLVLDMDKVDNDFGLVPGIDPIVPFMARGTAGAIHAVVCAGRLAVNQGRVRGVDEEDIGREMMAQTKAAIQADAGWHDWRDTLNAYATDLGPFYRARQFLGCC